MRVFGQTPLLSPAVRPRPALACILAFACASALAASAQTPQPAHHAARSRHRIAKPAAGQPVQPVAPPAPAAPPAPKWPVNDPAAPPTVTLNSQGLHIIAENSSLSSILNQVSTETGAKIEGLSDDERVFGDYGPGSPREVLAQLFNGANYNVLILGDLAQNEPIHVVLTPRRAGAPSQANGRPQQQEQEEDIPEPQEEPPQPYQPPVMNRPPNQPMRPMTPQERMQEMQERQREFQQQQQQQQPQ